MFHLEISFAHIWSVTNILLFAIILIDYRYNDEIVLLTKHKICLCSIQYLYPVMVSSLETLNQLFVLNLSNSKKGSIHINERRYIHPLFCFILLSFQTIIIHGRYVKGCDTF